MNNGSRRRNRRRYKVRYDRLILVALVMIVLIVIITSCTKSCSKKDGDENSQTSVLDELTTNPPAPVTDANGQNVTDAEGNAVIQPNSDAAASEYISENVEYSRINNGDLILVNSLYEYKFQEGDTNIIDVFNNRNSFYSVKDMYVMLDSNVIAQLNTIMEAYATASGNDYLRVIGGYRTLEAQNEKNSSGTSKFAAGYSDYHTARSFDLGIFPPQSDSNFYSPQGSYSWFEENAANYGFILRFPEGKDTFTGEEARTYTYRYVGVPHAIYMKQNNLCLEEYIEQIKTHTNSNPLSVANGAIQYQVYYVAANINNVTSVPVPSNRPYTISGNNVDGFIVTVTIA